MIAKLAPKRRAGRGSFGALQQYLERDELGRERPDLVASWSGLVASHETAALEMEAVARQRQRLGDPVYHVILSTRPGEALDVEQAKLAVDAVRRSVGADEHQYFAALHHDADTDRYHVHLAINKVSVRGRSLDRWQDYAKLARAAEWCEREMGLQVDRHLEWRSKLGERALDFIPDLDGAEHALGIAQGLDRQEGATIDGAMRCDARITRGLSFCSGKPCRRRRLPSVARVRVGPTCTPSCGATACGSSRPGVARGSWGPRTGSALRLQILALIYVGWKRGLDRFARNYSMSRLGSGG